MTERHFQDIMNELHVATHVTLPPSVVIFGSARIKPGNPDYQAAQETARLLAAHGYGVITGGGPGIMEAANRGAQESGGTSVGCAIELPFEKGANAYLSIELNFKRFFTRKVAMIQLLQPCAFVAFPGGLGTLDELFEVATLAQTGKISRVPIVLFGSEFWSGLINWMKTVMYRDRQLIELEDIDFHIVNTPTDVYNAIVQQKS